MLFKSYNPRMKKTWGFDTRDMDTQVRAQDDFFTYAGGTWLKKHPIPQTESRWGSFMMLRYDTDKKLRAMVSELEKTRSVPAGSPEQLVRDFYRSGMDMSRRRALGIRPIQQWRDSIENIHDQKTLLAAIAQLHRIGVGVFWGGVIDQDSKNSTAYILHLHQDGLGLPDRDYYLNDDAESKRVRDAYLPFVASMHKLAGYPEQESMRRAHTVLHIETMLARVSMNKVDARDADKTYHKKSLRDLKNIAPQVDWAQYFTDIGGARIQHVIATQPEFLRGVSKLLTSIPLADWKIYLEWHVINDFAGALSPAFVAKSFSFYGTVLTGTKVMKPLWRRTLGTVNGTLGELLGKIYVKKYFSPLAKKKMNVLVDDLFTAYEARLKNLDWMTPATKKKALMKLRSMNRKIGYPDTWKSYTGLVIRADDYVGNIVRTSEYEHRRQMKKLGKPIDRGEWFMYPQTVNAYFSPTMNDIVFPAAILQPPFFSLTADDAINYGSIGSVIGHEITHGFDDQGSKYDHTGNLKSWWTKADRTRFMKKAQQVVKQYDAYRVADGVPVNGKLTLGENIADLGGLSIALDAYRLALAREGRKDIDGFTPEQRFMLGFSLFERERTRPEFAKTQVLTDPHSPSIFRVNGPLSNLEEFYTSFNVQKGDKLFRTPTTRAKIW